MRQPRSSQDRFRLGAIILTVLPGVLFLFSCQPEPQSDAAAQPPVEPAASAEPAAGTPAVAEDTPPPERQAPEHIMTYEEANGFDVFQRYCKVCHGERGEGDGFNAYNLDPKPRSLLDKYASQELSNEELARSISLGGVGRNRSPLMPPFGHTLTTRQIRYVTSYLRLLQRDAAQQTAGDEKDSSDNQ